MNPNLTLAESEYETHREAVMGMLGKRFPRFDADQRLELYHDAWERVLRKRQAGEEIENLRAYLMQTVAWEAMHLVSHRKAPTPLEPSHPAILALPAQERTPDEQVEVEDQVRICREVIDSLSPRHRAVLKLRWDVQMPPAEIRQALRLTARQYKRLAREGAMVVAERVSERQDGTWSERQRSLLAACLVGIATDEQRAEAERRMRTDPHVAALCRELNGSLGRAAALLPLPVLFGDAALAGGGLREVVAAAKVQLGELASAGKQQAVALYLRAADPTPLATARPGAAVAAITGCLALGGGGTYCALEGVPDSLRAPLGIETRAERKSETPDVRVAPSPVPAPQEDVAPPAIERSKPEPPEPPSPDVTDEQPAPAAVTPAQAPAPAPAPATSDGEFGFEQ